MADELGSDSDNDDMMAELRKALSNLGDDELAASDGRVLDGFVEDRKGQFDAFENELARDLDNVQESFENRLEGELRGVEEDMLSRIDAAVDELRRGEADKAGSAGSPGGSSVSTSSEAGADADALPSAELSDDALVVVAGANTPLGTMVVRAISARGCGWQLRALVPEGENVDPIVSSACDVVTLAPFAPTALSKSVSGAAALVVVSEGAGGAKGGIEPEVVPKLMKAVGPGMRRLVMLSTHGVERADKLPFNLANVFGQLDKQRAAEQEIALRATNKLPSFSIMRVGKLKDDSAQVPPSAFGGPPNSRAELAAGDALGGELSLSTAAAVAVETLRRPESINASFSLGAPASGAAGLPADTEHWDDQFLKLVGPEIYRRPLDCLPPEETTDWLREWARRFLRPDAQLTTPVAVQDVDDGVLLRFLTRATGYADFDKVETADEKWAATKPGAMEAKAGKPDGALLLTAESLPAPRVRVTRAEMADGVLVKEMSERAVIERLDKDLADLERLRQKNR
jgi:hypothetical protein